MNNRVETAVQRPADLLRNDIAFVIPSYQRPYVWPDDDVLKLLDDIHTAKKENEHHYFIGTLLTAEHHEIRQDGVKVLELIDGQQRATTLMLIALAMRELQVDSPLTAIATVNNESRLTFVIRDQVQSLLGAWSGLPNCQLPGEDAIKNDPYLTRLYGALRALYQKLNKLSEKECKELADYIHERVQWVCNIVPNGMDLNRLFATMNTSGMQLEQADILKSMLLKQVKSNKAKYEGIWQACEQMENYFERNVRQIFSGSDWNQIKPQHLKSFDGKVFLLSNKASGLKPGEVQRLTINDLAGDFIQSSGESSPNKNTQYVDETEDAEPVYCRSIIRFSLLLMHAYRIYQWEREDISVRLHSDRLIESFSDLIHSDEKSVKAFIECLWQVRYYFDQWVVKWVKSDSDEEEHLGLTSVTRSKPKNKWYIQRSYKENSALGLLQSVRYFTGERSAQYWLTSFLGGLITDEHKKEDQVLELLEDIDNQLSLAVETQKEASYKLLSNDLDEQEPFEEIKQYLADPQGTRFEHYWFQKLEYLLWKNGDKTKDKKLAKYRIVSRNSIEHVHPQNEEYKEVLEKKYLDAFGNLVLLNPGQNSSYSNQKVEKKKIDFLSKTGYDSLKLKHIFDLMGNDHWSSDKIKQHEEEMLKIFEMHYTTT